MPEALTDGAEQFAAAGADPTLDLVMQKDPRDVTDADLEHLVLVLRQERALFIQKGAS